MKVVGICTVAKILNILRIKFIWTISSKISDNGNVHRIVLIICIVFNKKLRLSNTENVEYYSIAITIAVYFVGYFNYYNKNTRPTIGNLLLIMIDKLEFISTKAAPIALLSPSTADLYIYYNL